MTEFGKSAWNAKARERKAKRDEVRDAFWAATGGAPKGKTSEIEVAPAGQLLTMVRLLQLTRDGLDAPDVGFFAQTARALHAVGLGKGPMGEVAKNIMPIDSLGTFDLETFFINEYKYEGPRNTLAPDGEDEGVHVPGCTSGPRPR